MMLKFHGVEFKVKNALEALCQGWMLLRNTY